jgi:uncharacterized membrane protein
MAAPAFLGHLSRNTAMNDTTGALALVQRPRFLWISRLLAAAEMVAAKLPIAPKRTASGPLLGSALTGGLSGAALCSVRRQSVLTGGLIGAATAMGVAWGAYHLRKRAAVKLHVPKIVIALAEDAIVGGLGATLTYGLRTATPALKRSSPEALPHSPSTPS